MVIFQTLHAARSSCLDVLSPSADTSTDLRGLEINLSKRACLQYIDHLETRHPPCDPECDPATDPTCHPCCDPDCDPESNEECRPCCDPDKDSNCGMKMNKKRKRVLMEVLEALYKFK